MTERTSFFKDPRVRRARRWLVSLLALGFVLWVLPLRDRCTEQGCQDGLLSTFRRTNLPLLGALFGVYLLGNLAWAARWAMLLRLAGVELGLRAAWRVTLEAQAGGILLPGGVAGDALRVAYAKARAPGAPVAKIAASIMADRIVGLVTLASMALALALGFHAARQVAVAIPMLAGIPLGALVLWYVVRHPRLAELGLFKTKLGLRILTPMLEYAASPEAPRTVRRSFVLSLLVSGTQLLVVRGLVATVGGVPSTEGWLHVGAAFAMIVSAVPITPGGWGTGDAAFVFFFRQAGIAAAQAAAVCLLYRLMWYAIGLMGAAIAFVRTPPKREGPEDR